MSLLHATWLPAIRTPSSSGQPALLVWADTWRVATPEGPGLTPALHPFTLSHNDLRAWLGERDLLPGSNEQWMTWSSAGNKPIPDLWMLLMRTPHQHERLPTIQPAFQGSQATGGRIDPDAALRLQRSNPEHIGLHRRQTDIAKRLF